MLQAERVNSIDGRVDNVTGSIINLVKKMGTQIKLWQLLSSVIAVIIAVGGLVWHQATKITQQDKDIEYLKRDNAEIRLYIKDINSKLDVMSIKQEDRDREKDKQLTEILVILQNKQNRKNEE